MIRNNITQMELLDAVICYEKEVRHSEYVGETEKKYMQTNEYVLHCCI